MKRLFFSVFALTLGAFAFWSCDKEEEIDNGKGKPAERGSFMTVQQQRDAFQGNMNGIVEALDFTDLANAAGVIADAAGKKWSIMSLMPVMTDSVLAEDTLFAAKISQILEFVSGDYESFEGTDIDLRPFYMAADIHVVDTVFYDEAMAAVVIEKFKSDVDQLALNLFIDNHTITIRAKVEPGDATFAYTNVLKHINSTLALPETVNITITLDEKVILDVRNELESDYTASYTSGESSFVIEGSKTSAKGYAKFAGYEYNSKLDFDNATGANGIYTIKCGTTELFSYNIKMDATMVGVNMADSAQVLAWLQNPEKLKSISMGSSLRGGKVEFKLNVTNPFKDAELAKILRSQMMPDAKLTKEQEMKMVERINQVVDGGFYFEGFKDPQAKLKFVYREIADDAEPVDNEKINSIFDPETIGFVSETVHKGGAYTVLVVHDDEGYEKEIQLEEYFTGIDIESLKASLLQKALEAFGPVIAKFMGGDE